MLQSSGYNANINILVFHVKADIYDANTQTVTHERHMNLFNTPSTDLLQRQCSVDIESCQLSLPSRKLSVGFSLMEG